MLYIHPPDKSKFQSFASFLFLMNSTVPNVIPYMFMTKLEGFVGI